ncbi:organic solute transporter [Chloropicon primus]|uniref:Uncharacterized protein n=1 Tax=Chloropicon primus TaxID=1764295 RepID=A0A5B8MJY0_9CHLO|nr:hypothetical protein A3770_04p34460 [Chloropicon primus]UPR00138.1 organic solute transporter [Chloropicon primus]|eukprot:QDZ20928.1 hypothetical protein A3770_04p34460 [Chloropicon primus]
MKVSALVSELALDVVFQSSVLFLCLISSYICFRTFQEHLSIGSLPALQICCFRVVAIAPVYGFIQWAKLLLTPLFPLWKTLQEFAEAYSIYCYWVMLILWVGGQKRTIELLEEQSRESHRCSLCPLLGVRARGCSCPLYTFSTPMARFKFWRFSMRQLIIVKVLKGVLVLLAFKGYGMRLLHFFSLMSVSLAMHCILETYVALRGQLEDFQAERKFLCIKILVVLALLQPLLTNALETIGAFPDDAMYGYSDSKWSERLLGTISVIQMVLFSLLLSFTFSLRNILRDQRESAGVGEEERVLHRVKTAPKNADVGLKMTVISFLKIWDILVDRLEDSTLGLSHRSLKPSSDTKASELDA